MIEGFISWVIILRPFETNIKPYKILVKWIIQKIIVDNGRKLKIILGPIKNLFKNQFDLFLRITNS